MTPKLVPIAKTFGSHTYISPLVSKHNNLFHMSLGKAVEAMLHHSVIHRDIKPQNILLCKCDPRATEVNLFDCTAKLADFGVAKVADRASTTVCGTFDYMAPEVIRCLAERQGSYDAKCDMFSVGVVLHQCVTGKLPFLVSLKATF